jgi:hypothetical protein
MIVANPTDPSIPFPLIEAGLTLILVALSFLPPVGANLFKSIESALGRLARRRGLSVVVVGLTALLVRLAMLPLCPIPLPFVPDDFSFLLGADTFLHGRLTNPTPLMWTHFESIHITMYPTYMSMYFPSTAVVLAGGKLLFGHPWFGILIVTSLMCAAICWMLQAWVPPSWALLGGLLAVLRLGLFSYWINTYSGGGSISALGGALVLGSLPRLMKSIRVREGMLMAMGIVLLMTTRPYEGLLLCLPVAFVLARWIFAGKNGLSAATLARRAALPLVLVVAGGACLGYYDYRAFGKVTTLPYTIDRATYAITPYFVWQKLRPEPEYRHALMKTFYTVNELKSYDHIHSITGFPITVLEKIGVSLVFFAGFGLLPVLMMSRRVFLDRRIRFLVVCLLVLGTGMLIQIYLIPHYLAPFTCVFYALGMQGLRHLRVWRAGGQPAGLTMVRLLISLCVVLAGVRLFAAPLHIQMLESPPSQWIIYWYGPGHFGTERARVQKQLESMPGKQLVLVRYPADYDPIKEWVYNEADIDDSKVIWAREMDADNNSKLTDHYKDRRVWLVEPDAQRAKVEPYPAASGKQP